MRTSGIGGLAWLCAAFFAGGAASGCDVPVAADADPRAYLLPEVGLMIVNRHRGGLAALDLATGRPRWSANPPRDLDPAHGHFGPGNLGCAPRASAQGWILLSYTAELRVVSASDGHGRWRRSVAAQGACPTLSRDNGVVVATFATPHGAIEKFDAGGQPVWTAPLPDVGPVQGELHTEPSSGDTLGRTYTHTFSVSPGGQINWVRNVGALGAGAL